ncbi:lysophospholipid acyltransferase family protein (plasmid) [Streptomyces sp. BI20]|uniref:lysophospholipid acyltransferase family protein n=1 Tax=Streptomyces sp. BI20 TaxID=3403460 RepID=UPI003C71F6C0
MLSSLASVLAPAFGRLTVTARDHTDRIAPGSILVANHTSLADPALVLAALRRRFGAEPVVLATAGLWRVPLLGSALAREGHIPVHRGTARAGDALAGAAPALAAGKLVLLYAEGHIPEAADSGDRPPEPFRTGVARLALATGAPVVPIGQAGARRISSGSTLKQLAGVLTAPVRRPSVHVHVEPPIHFPAGLSLPEATALAHSAVTSAWRVAANTLRTTRRSDPTASPNVPLDR